MPRSLSVSQRGRDTETKTEREREEERQTTRRTGNQTNRQTHGQTSRRTEGGMMDPLLCFAMICLVLPLFLSFPPSLLVPACLYLSVKTFRVSCRDLGLGLGLGV